MSPERQRSQEDLGRSIAPALTATKLEAPASDAAPALSRRPADASDLPAASRTTKPLIRYLPQVAVATALVAFSPVAIVWLLRSAGVIRSPWLCLALAVGLSTALSRSGCAYWKRSSGSGDLLFSELLIWGWLGRWRAERQLANAVQLLGLVPTDRVPPAGERSVERQQRLLRQVAAALDAEDRYTRGHSDRVARYAASIARNLGLSRREVETIRAAALVHDVGKLRIAPEILDKPSRLTDAEFEVIKRHPTDGAGMVAGLGNEQLTAIVLHHHERLDGDGYPGGLAGERIPIGARIIAVADTFDAITSVRAYRPRRDHKQALDILAAEQGHQLDRDAVRAFVTCYSGRRSVVVWSILTSTVARTISWLTGEASAATITTGNVVATALTTVAIGGVAMASPLVIHSHHIPVHGLALARSAGLAGGPQMPAGGLTPAGYTSQVSPPAGARGISAPGPSERRRRRHEGRAATRRRGRHEGGAAARPRAASGRAAAGGHTSLAGHADVIAPGSTGVKVHKVHAVKVHKTHPVKVHKVHAVKVHKTHPVKVHKTHMVKVHKPHPVKVAKPHAVKAHRVRATHPAKAVTTHPAKPPKTHPAKAPKAHPVKG